MLQHHLGPPGFVEATRAELAKLLGIPAARPSPTTGGRPTPAAAIVTNPAPAPMYPRTYTTGRNGSTNPAPNHAGPPTLGRPTGREGPQTSLREQMISYVQDQRPENTSQAYAFGWSLFERYCAEQAVQPAPNEALLAGCMRSLLERGYARGTINGVPSAVADRYKFDNFSPSCTPLVRAMKRVVIQHTLPPKRRKEIPRSTFRLLIIRMLTLFHQTSSLLLKTTLVRDLIAFLLIYKAYMRPERVVELGHDDTEERFVDSDPDLDGNPGPLELCLQILVRDGKNNRGGHPHVVLLCAGREECFNLIQWRRTYLRLEQALRQERGVTVRPPTLLYNLHTPFGKNLSPSTVTGRLKRYRHMFPDIGLEHLTAYCFRVAGVSDAVRQGVKLHLIQRHGNWRSLAVFRYVCEDDAEALKVTRVL